MPGQAQPSSASNFKFVGMIDILAGAEILKRPWVGKRLEPFLG